MNTDIEEFRIVGARVPTPETDPLLAFVPGRLTLVYRYNHVATAIWSHRFRDEVLTELAQLQPYTTHWTVHIPPLRDMFSVTLPFESATPAILAQLKEVLERGIAAANRAYRSYRQDGQPSAILAREEAWEEGLRNNEQQITTRGKEIENLLAQQFRLV